MAKNIIKYFGLDYIPKFLQTIKDHGGWWPSIYKVFITDNLRPGCCVGVDKMGNMYFENNSFFYGRNRWVEYNPNVFLDYDASQIPPEWFGWLHYKTDLLPQDDPSRPSYKWMLPYEENRSGTPGQFYPYSTTRPKIHAWVPPAAGNKKDK